MKYVVRNPAINGDSCNLGSVAHAMAIQKSTAGGWWDEKTYDVVLIQYSRWLCDEARSGRLVVSTHLGIPVNWSDLMKDGEPNDPVNACSLAWVNLSHLNAWAEHVGHEFDLQTEGVPWISERGVEGGKMPPLKITIDGVTQIVELHHFTPEQPTEVQEGKVTASDEDEDKLFPSDPSPPPLKTNEIAECFNKVGGYDYGAWKRKLAKPNKWIHCAIVQRGEQGKRQTTWDPVKFGAALIRRRMASTTQVGNVFKKSPLLEPWRQAWEMFVYQSLLE